MKPAVWSEQGGGGRDDDYVSRSEFRLLLVSCTALPSIGAFHAMTSGRGWLAGVPEAVL